MTQIPCPFCGTDQAAVHRAILAKGVVFDKPIALICYSCGEPICATPDSFRQPTADEHVMFMSDDRLKLARGAWLQMKDRQQPPIIELWSAYAADKLANLKLANIKDDEELMTYAQEIFLSGVTLALTLFSNNLNDADSAEDFTSRMMLIEAEVKAMEAMMVNPEGTLQ